jgi:hypothetical protein
LSSDRPADEKSVSRKIRLRHVQLLFLGGGQLRFLKFGKGQSLPGDKVAAPCTLPCSADVWTAK